jgi:succinate dehydrogenase flavin-adding protein (antitoxin of CptAB toxin-antitoxin module)
MEKTSTLCYLIKTLSNTNISDIHDLESLFDEDDEDLTDVYDYLNNLKSDVRDEVIQKVIEFSKHYKEKTIK